MHRGPSKDYITFCFLDLHATQATCVRGPTLFFLADDTEDIYVPLVVFTHRYETAMKVELRPKLQDLRRIFGLSH
jgi:hypothetical protein